MNHLCGNVRLVLTSDMHLQQMFTDWEHLDMQLVVDEIVFSVGTSESGHNASQIIISCRSQFLCNFNVELLAVPDPYV